VSDLLDAADRNHIGASRGLMASTPAPAETEVDGVLLLSSGLPVAFFNPAFPSRGADPDIVVQRVVAHYGDLGLPFALYFRDDVVPRLADACLAAGMVEHWQPPIMVLDPIPVAPPPPDGLDVRVVDSDTLATYGEVLAVGFGMPAELAHLVIGRPTLEVAGFTALLGFLDGTPVATSGLFLSDALAGVYNVATVPEHRGKGLGAALTWAAARAGADAGLTRAVLQASQMGEPVYARMGYSTPARYRQMEPAG
jgi:GNAT superfamily N-acetyltransferase